MNRNLKRSAATAFTENKRSKFNPQKRGYDRKPVRSGRMLNPELKQLETFQSNTQIANGGTVYCINKVPQGTDIINRIGRHISMLGVDVNALFIAPSANLSYYDYVLVSLIYDDSPDASTPAYSTIFDTGIITAPVMAYRSTATYRDRFRVLWQERVFVGNSINTAPLTGSVENPFWRKYISLKGRSSVCEFLDTNTGTPSTGALYVTVSSYQNSSTAGQAASIQFGTKLIYTDL